MPISSYELKKFPNRVFVEAGSYIGDGIASALIAGFEEVHSVEINPHNHNLCVERFKNDKRVHLYLDDSGEWLGKILDQINEPCTIYLDANGWPLEKEPPIDAELRALKNHSNKYHTIIIDDMNHGQRPFEEILHGLQTGHLGERLRQINPNYLLSVMDSHTEDMRVTFNSWLGIATPPKNI